MDTFRLRTSSRHLEAYTLACYCPHEATSPPLIIECTLKHRIHVLDLSYIFVRAIHFTNTLVIYVVSDRIGCYSVQSSSQWHK